MFIQFLEALILTGSLATILFLGLYLAAIAGIHSANALTKRGAYGRRY